MVSPYTVSANGPHASPTRAEHRHAGRPQRQLHRHTSPLARFPQFTQSLPAIIAPPPRPQRRHRHATRSRRRPRRRSGGHKLAAARQSQFRTYDDPRATAASTDSASIYTVQGPQDDDEADLVDEWLREDDGDGGGLFSLGDASIATTSSALPRTNSKPRGNTAKRRRRKHSRRSGGGAGGGGGGAGGGGNRRQRRQQQGNHRRRNSSSSSSRRVAGTAKLAGVEAPVSVLEDGVTTAPLLTEATGSIPTGTWTELPGGKLKYTPHHS